MRSFKTHRVVVLQFQVNETTFYLINGNFFKRSFCSDIFDADFIEKHVPVAQHRALTRLKTET